MLVKLWKHDSTLLGLCVLLFRHDWKMKIFLLSMNLFIHTYKNTTKLNTEISYFSEVLKYIAIFSNTYFYSLCTFMKRYMEREKKTLKEKKCDKHAICKMLLLLKDFFSSHFSQFFRFKFILALFPSFFFLSCLQRFSSIHSLVSLSNSSLTYTWKKIFFLSRTFDDHSTLSQILYTQKKSHIFVARMLAHISDLGTTFFITSKTEMGNVVFTHTRD